ncbi:hypothetical protein SMC70_004083 [Cronobacter sakazakii]|nr:hypothetical protein [Cronobacter sakazakii]
MKGIIEVNESFPMSKEEIAHIQASIDKHWHRAKHFTEEDKDRMGGMMVAYAIGHHRGVKGIGEMLDWMHKED